MNTTSNLYEQYLSEQLKDAEFRGEYALARHKVHLEFLLETARTHIEKKSTSKILLADIRAIKRYINRIRIDQ